jgi:hypothetical protein
MSASHSWERHQRELDRDRDRERTSERDRVATAVAATLKARGVELTGTESSDQLADILAAVERFEAAVSEVGGDRMVNTPESSQPESEAFVLPRRGTDESAVEYADRILRAARRLLMLGG